MIKDELKNHSKHFYFSILFLLAFFCPILFTGTYYIDDFGRSISGYSGWLFDGRPVAEIVYLLINFGAPLPDISPLPQIFGLVCMAAAIAVAGKEIEPKRFALISLCLIPVAAFPTFLANISYKYDSSPMGLAFFLAVISARINGKTKSGFAVSSLLSLAFLSTYQPAINVFVIFCFIFYLTGSSARLDNKQILYKAMSLFIGVILYKFIIAGLTMGSSYAHQGTEILSIDNLYHGLLKNYASFSSVFKLSINSPVRILLYAAILVSTGTLLSMAFRIAKQKSRNIMTYGVLILSIPLSYVFVFGPLLLLKTPVVHPRVMIASGVFVSLLFCLCFKGSGKYKYITLIFTVPFIIYCAGVAYAFNNSQKAQVNYESYIGMSLVNNISSRPEISSIIVLGGPNHNPEYHLNVSKYPILPRLLRTLINNRDGWGEYQLRHYGMKVRYYKGSWGDIKEKGLCDKKALVLNSFYSIYVVDGVGVVDFNKSCPQM